MLDAAESTKAVVLASMDASMVGILMAASHSDRVQALVVVNGLARILRGDDYEIGLAVDASDALVEVTDPAVDAAQS